MTTLTVTMFLVAVGCGGSRPGGGGTASREICQGALDHLATIAESGENQIPRDKYLAENKGLVEACTGKWTMAKLECVMAMPDITGDAWAKCR